MATVTKGVTLATNEFLESTDLNSIVNSATIAGINRDDADQSNTSFIHRAASAPSTPYNNEWWFDTATQTVRYQNPSTARFDVWAKGIMLQSESSSSSVNKGDVAAILASEKFNAPGNGGVDEHRFVFGVLAENISAGSTGVLINNGIADVNVNAAITRGQFVEGNTISVAGGSRQAVPTSTKTFNCFGIALTSTAGAGTCKCLLFR